MGWCKKDVTPVRQQWSNVFIAVTHRYYEYGTQNMRSRPRPVDG